MPRPLRSPSSTTARRRRKELAIFDTAAEIHRRYGPRRCPTTSSPRPTAVSDMLELALLLKEVGLLQVAAQAPAAVNIIPLFETIDDLRGCAADHGRAVLASRATGSC